MRSSSPSPCGSAPCSRPAGHSIHAGTPRLPTHHQAPAHHQAQLAKLGAPVGEGSLHHQVHHAVAAAGAWVRREGGGRVWGVLHSASSAAREHVESVCPSRPTPPSAPPIQPHPHSWRWQRRRGWRCRAASAPHSRARCTPAAPWPPPPQCRAPCRGSPAAATIEWLGGRQGVFVHTFWLSSPVCAGQRGSGSKNKVAARGGRRPTHEGGQRAPRAQPSPLLPPPPPPRAGCHAPLPRPRVPRACRLSLDGSSRSRTRSL